MTRCDLGIAGLLALLTFFIWFRDLSWQQAPSDTLPILAGFPLYVWLSRPWKRSNVAESLSAGPLAAAAFFFPVGILLNSTLVLAASWTALLWSWISVRFIHLEDSPARKLLILPLLSFPWIFQDLESVGWIFRLSATAMAERLLALGPFDVVRQGTYLSVDGFSVSVEAACSGLNGLQALLMAGSVLACLKLKRTGCFWWNLPILVAAAWAANFLRIVLAALGGTVLKRAGLLSWFEPLHLMAGGLTLCLMLGLCWVWFGMVVRITSRAGFAPAASKPWLEIALVSYCLWRCRDLFGNWMHNPFDQLGWLAFLIWVLPIVPVPAPRRLSAEWSPGALESRRFWFQALGLAVTFLGDIGDFNFVEHMGMTLVLAGFASPGHATIWCLGAVGWLPASGWLASRAGFEPGVVAVLRVLAAATVTVWLLRRNHRKPSADLPTQRSPA